jgi:hypothetical protein
MKQTIDVDDDNRTRQQQIIVEQLRAVAHMRCLQTLLPSLVWVSRWQRLEDTAHPSPRCMQRNRADKI